MLDYYLGNRILHLCYDVPEISIKIEIFCRVPQGFLPGLEDFKHGVWYCVSIPDAQKDGHYLLRW